MWKIWKKLYEQHARAASSAMNGDSAINIPALQNIISCMLFYRPIILELLRQPKKKQQLIINALFGLCVAIITIVYPRIYLQCVQQEGKIGNLVRGVALIVYQYSAQYGRQCGSVHSGICDDVAKIIANKQSQPDSQNANNILDANINACIAHASTAVGAFIALLQEANKISH